MRRFVALPIASGSDVAGRFPVRDHHKSMCSLTVPRCFACGGVELIVVCIVVAVDCSLLVVVPARINCGLLFSVGPLVRSRLASTLRVLPPLAYQPLVWRGPLTHWGVEIILEQASRRINSAVIPSERPASHAPGGTAGTRGSSIPVPLIARDGPPQISCAHGG